MVVLMGLILLQVIRPMPLNATTSNETHSRQASDNNNTSGGKQSNSSYSNIVPNKASPVGSGIYGGGSSPPPPLIPYAPPSLQSPLSDSFHPSIAVIIGVLSTMFSLTFLILLYAKHCRGPPVSLYASPVDPDVVHPAPLAHILAGGPSLLFADRDSGLDRAVIQALPMFSFSSLKGMKDGLECSVCLSRYENPEILRLLPKCKHAFHLECVDVWLRSHSTCPLCRVRVDAQDTLVVEDFIAGFNKFGSEPASFRRQSARISLSELADSYLDHAFEFYVQRETESADILAGSCWQNGSGRSSWRKDGASSERKLGSWRSSTNFSGPFGASEKKEIGSSARVAPLQRKSSELHGSLRKYSDAALPAPLNSAAAGGDDHYFYDEQLARRLGHRIIVSDVMFQHRWSDFLPSDVPFFDAHMVQLREPSVAVSSELTMQKAAGNNQEGPKETELEMGLRKIAAGDRSARMSSARVVDAEVAVAGALQGRAEQGAAEKQRKHGGNQIRGGSRLRCMSELSGLQRVQQGAAGKQLFNAAAAEDDHENITPGDETTRRWFATARRTLKWLLGSGPSPSSPSCPIQP